MKHSRNLIATLVGLCVLIAMLAFFLPGRNGMVLSYLTISLAALVGVLCVGGMIRLLSHGE